MKVLAVFFLFALAGKCSADLIQVNVGGDLTLEQSQPPYYNPMPVDPFVSSVSVAGTTPYQFSFVYDNTALPDPFPGEYPGESSSLIFGDYNESAATVQYSISASNTFFQVIIPGFFLGQTLIDPTLSLDVPDNPDIGDSRFQGFGLSDLTYSSLNLGTFGTADYLLGPVTSYSTVDLSVPEPSVGSLLLISLALMGVAGHFRVSR